MATKIANTKGFKGIKGATGSPGPTTLSSDAGNIASLGSDSLLYVPTTTLPLASASVNGLLSPLSGKTTDYLDGTNTFNDLVTNIRPTIYSSRLYTSNAIGNPNFEVAQRHAGAALNNPSGFPLLEDRWVVRNTASPGTANFQSFTGSAGILVPGTNFAITSAYLRVTVGTQKTSLASADAVYVMQYVEGPSARPLLGGAHSISLLARSSVANLNFGVSLQSAAGTTTLCKRCTLGAANTVSLISLPNLPAFPGGATWSSTPGSSAFSFMVILAAGSAFTTAANDVWQSSSSWGPIGVDNFLANAAGATFDLCFIQHEPGPDCSLPIDIIFPDNLRACQRYFCKNLSYSAVAPVANGPYGHIGQYVNGTTIRGRICFPVEMAKVPTVTIYGYGGVVNQIYLDGVGDVAITPPPGGITTTGIQSITLAAAPATQWAGAQTLGQWTADTGW